MKQGMQNKKLKKTEGISNEEYIKNLDWLF